MRSLSYIGLESGEFVDVANTNSYKKSYNTVEGSWVGVRDWWAYYESKLEWLLIIFFTFLLSQLCSCRPMKRPADKTEVEIDFAMVGDNSLRRFMSWYFSLIRLYHRF